MRVAKAVRYIALAIVAATLSTVALAQSYPNRPITIVVVFAAGGPSDTIARLIADHIGRQFGQQVIIENVAGAGGTTGTERVAKAAPDGYTILTHHGAHAAAPALYSNLRYDPKGSFETLGLINTGPMALISRKTLEAKTLAEVVAWAKEKGDKATIGFAGVGSNSFVCATLFQQQIGAKVSMVPYRGTGPAMADLVGGQIDLLCDQATTAVPQIQANTVKAFVVTSKQRLASLPDVPSNVEAGLPGFEHTIWNAAYAPKGTPKEIVDRWNEALGKFVTDPATLERFAATGTVPFPPEMRSTEAHGKWLDQQFDFFAKMFAAANLKKEEAK